MSSFWGPPHIEIAPLDLKHEGEDISILFPYRVIDGLRNFGSGSIPALKKQLSSLDQRIRIRTACALATLDVKNTEQYEDVITTGLQSENISLIRESLFALRCFPQITTEDCIRSILAKSIDAAPTNRMLVAKVLRDNCIQTPEVENAIQILQKDSDYSVREVAINKQKSIWEEIYYYWIP